METTSSVSDQPQEQQALWRWLAILGAVAVLILAFGLRVHHLGAQSFWNDEGNSYVQATRSLSEIAANAARDIHPPGYYWLLSGWRVLSGDSEFGLRALSTFASVLAVAFAYALGKQLYQAPVGLLAALLIAINSFSIYYAQEARMYALLSLWAVMGMWALVGLIRWRTWRWVWVLALVNTAGLWTQYAYAFVMIAQGVLMLIWCWMRLSRRRIAAWAWVLGLFVVANLIAITLFLPWLPTALHQISTWSSQGAPVPLAEAVGAILELLTFGMTSAWSNAGALAVSNFLLLFALLPVQRRQQSTWRMLIPVMWVIVTIVIFLAFSLYRPQNMKLLIPAQIAMALWLARGVWVLWHVRTRPVNRVLRLMPRFAAVIGAAWLVWNAASGMTALYHDPSLQRHDYRTIVAQITAEQHAGDAIVLNAPNQQEVFDYYYRGGAPVYGLPAGLGGDDAETLTAIQTIIATHDRVFAVFWGEAERDPNRVVETELDTHTFEVGDTWYGDVRLSRYVMPADMFTVAGKPNAVFGDHITLASYALNRDRFHAGDVLQVRLDWRTDAALDQRYKVFVQVLDAEGALVAQRDSEPVGGLALTTTWTPRETIQDQHGLLLPLDLPAGDYTLIVGMYDLDPPHARLPVDDGDYLPLIDITITAD